MTKSSYENYKILAGFPQTEDKSVPIGGQHFYSEGFIIQFFKSDGSYWIANCKKGFTSLNWVSRFSDKDEFAVIAGGKGYIINNNLQKAILEFGHGYLDHSFLFNDGTLLVFDLDTIFMIYSNGEVWHSERISWDGFKDLKLEGDFISGFSYDPMNKNNNWTPFSFNLITKELKGGSYPKYKTQLQKKIPE